MTEMESKKLKPDDAVVFSDGVAGKVLFTHHYGVTMQWDDGQTGVIAHADMQDVERLR